MEIIHTWKVRKLIQKNDGSGLVIQVFYKVYSTDGEYSYASAGNIELDIEDISNYVPYQDLTEELVLQWVRYNLGPELGNHEQVNIDWITAARNPITPAIKIENLPWQIQEPVLGE